jgi:GNAT superfamily N-acetyltransferase
VAGVEPQPAFVVAAAVSPEEAAAALPAYEWLFAPPGSVPDGWHPGAAEERLHAVAGSGRAELLLARSGDDIVGLCCVFLDIGSVRFGQRAWVEDLAVDPNRRSEGIGKALLDAAKDWARERGATHLELDSGLDRADAHRFYERERPSWVSKCFAWKL